MMSISYRSSLGEDEVDSHHSLLGSTTITTTNEEYISSDIESEEDEQTQKKKFLFKLVSQLHRAGNFSFRTEVYITQVASAFNLHAYCAVFPVSAILSFQESAQLSPHNCESYNIAISSGYDCSKLSRLDQLCFDIQQGRLDFHSAQVILHEIENDGLYPWYIITMAYGLTSFAATLLFFGGDLRDGGWAFFLGLLVNFCGHLCAILPGLSEIECFVSPFIVSLTASIVDKFLFNQKLCLYGQLFGGIVWLLPGITITIGLLEIYSKMPMYGSARLVYGISLASQLGFGLTLGYMLASNSQQIPDSFINGCREPISIYYGFILLPIMATSFAIMISSAYRQIPGMILTCGVGVVTSHIALYYGAGVAAIPFIASMTVTIIGRIYAYLDGNQRPFTYIITGLLVLVPGGVGVRGMSDMWSGNSQTGIEFTFRMLMVAVSLAMGMFIALIPSQKWFMIKVKTQSNSTKLFGNDIQLTIINPLGSKEYRSHRLDSIESC
mmetsp:Transcript_14366/g.15020  ORF Transcript_14366/g.15020 Transcript_14366/m.15020 type:complete len:496 (-) Transcript_14366:38-1525(-)